MVTDSAAKPKPQPQVLITNLASYLPLGEVVVVPISEHGSGLFTQPVATIEKASAMDTIEVVAREFIGA
jgi:hypothetical protein